MSKLTNCKDCGNVVSKNADACPSCGAKVKRTSVLTWIAVIFIGFMVLSAVMAGMSGETTESDPVVSTDENVSADEPVVLIDDSNEEPLSAAPATTSNWQYDESIDEMRGGSSYFAINTSTNAATLEFPYGEGVQLNIIIRDDVQNGKDILFAVNKGQLFCSYQDCYISVKFDDGSVERLVANEAEAGSSEVLFLADDTSGFVDKLKRAEKLMVEVNFYNHGDEQFKFDVSGLEWTRF